MTRTRWFRDAGHLALAAGFVAAAAWGIERAHAQHGQVAPSAVLDPAETAAGQGPVRYELEASLDALAHRVHGKGTIRWTNTSSMPQGELWLHAYLNAFKDESSLFMRRVSDESFRGSGRPDHAGRLDIERFHVRELARDLATSFTFGEPGDETDVRVTLPEPVAPGGTLTIDVAFTAELPTIVLRTGYVGSFHMVAQWFPKLARLEADGRWNHFAFHRLSEFDADFGDYDVTVEVPESFVVGATGEPMEASSAGGRRRERYVATRVHDFAFTAWDGFETLQRSVGGIDLVALHPHGEAEEAAAELDVAARGLAYFGARYGAYPYRRLTIVRPPAKAHEAGGMEYPTLITTGGSLRGRRLGLRTLESLTLHELAHQWFYGLVASDEHRWPMLDEGLASFAELDAMNHFWPGASAFDALGWRVGEVAAYRVAAAGGIGRLDRAAAEFTSGRDYGRNVYARTATALAMLGRLHGEEALLRAIGRYARAHRFAHPTPEDLHAAIRAEIGEDAERQLRAAVAGERLDVSVVNFESHAEAGGAVGRIVVRRDGGLVVPVDIDVRTTRGTVSRLRWDGVEAQAVLSWSGDAPIESVSLDPDGRLLLDSELRNQVAGPRRFPFRVWSLAHVLAQTAFEVLAP